MHYPTNRYTEIHQGERHKLSPSPSIFILARLYHHTENSYIFWLLDNIPGSANAIPLKQSNHPDVSLKRLLIFKGKQVRRRKLLPTSFPSSGGMGEHLAYSLCTVHLL